MSGNDKVTYVGSFPPPYGGVTVKNSLLYRHLADRLDLRKVNSFDVKKGKPAALAAFAGAVLGRGGSVVLGMSTTWRRRVARALCRLNPAKAGRSICFVMGGASPTSGDVDAFRGLRRVYVETEGMLREYEAAGLGNVAVYPNCREHHIPAIEPRTRKVGEPLRCVYFSLISEEKGAPTVLTAAEALPEVVFHFYGRIDPVYEAEFKAVAGGLSNVAYHGVFDSVQGDAIGELSQYDLHLFPTRYPNEGVPGVIAETKMAGLPTITTDTCRNGELVQDGVDGFLLAGDLPQDDARSTAELIRRLEADNDLLTRMKRAALASAERFYIDKYIDGIVRVLRGECSQRGCIG